MAEEKELDNVIEIIADDGQVLKCELYDVIEVNGREYALLTQVGADLDAEDAELVIMRYAEEDGEAFLEAIESDEEFEAVSKYIDEIEE